MTNKEIENKIRGTIPRLKDVELCDLYEVMMLTGVSKFSKNELVSLHNIISGPPLSNRNKETLFGSIISDVYQINYTEGMGLRYTAKQRLGNVDLFEMDRQELIDFSDKLHKSDLTFLAMKCDIKLYKSIRKEMVLELADQIDCRR